MEGVALGTRSRAKSAELEEGILTALKNKPRAVRHALAVRNGLIRCFFRTVPGEIWTRYVILIL